MLTDARAHWHSSGHRDASGTTVTALGDFEVYRVAYDQYGSIGYRETTEDGVPVTAEAYRWMAIGLGLVTSVQEIHIGPMEGIPELSEEIVMTVVIQLTDFSDIDGEKPGRSETSVQSATWGQIKATF